jgi:hypothetical protein
LLVNPEIFNKYSVFSQDIGMARRKPAAVDLAALLRSWELSLRAERKPAQTIKNSGVLRAAFGAEISRPAGRSAEVSPASAAGTPRRRAGLPQEAVRAV